jgi:hypothetical protein
VELPLHRGTVSQWSRYCPTLKNILTVSQWDVNPLDLYSKLQRNVNVNVKVVNCGDEQVQMVVVVSG